MTKIFIPQCTPVLGQTSYLCLPCEVNPENWQNIEEDLFSHLSTGRKVRIIWENPAQTEIINHILETLEVQILGLHFNFYPTQFYKINLANIPSLIASSPELDWNEYKDEFKIIQVNNPNQPEFSIVLDFCKNSNGVVFSKDIQGKTIIAPDTIGQEIIEKQLPVVATASLNNIFLVLKNTTPIQYVGVFDLVDFGHEWQLHYTSGKSSLDKNYLYSGKKMPVLAAAIYHIMSTKLSIKELTFSSKDEAVKKIYNQVGFEVFQGRRCVVAQVK